MFELEALLLGLEPMTAAAVGVGVLVLGPVVGAIDSATGNTLSEGARSATKTALVWGLQAFESAQSAVAEASESFQDLVAEAKSDMSSSKNGSSDPAPREVTIG